MLLRLATFATLLAAAAPAHADTEDTRPSQRTLGGHPFLPSLLLSDPFVGSQYGNVTSVGAAGLREDQAEVASKGVTDNLGSRLSFVAYQNTLVVQQGIADVVAIRGAIAGSLLTGSNDESAWLVGAVGQPAFAIGVAGRLIRAGPFQATLSADFGQQFSFQVSPENVLNQAIAQNQVPRNILVRSTHLAFTPSLSAAVAIHRTVGLMASTGVAFGSTSGPGASAEGDTVGSVGAGLSFNLEPEGIPIGALVAVNHDFSHGPKSLDATGFEAGIFPVSFGHFSLGLEALVERRGYDRVTVQNNQGESVDIAINQDTAAFQVTMLYAR